MNRIGNWMQTYSGKAFYPYDLRVEDFCIEDIAHALSMLCRYGGHCKKFYSVAEHSVLLSYEVPLEDALAGLMHDATEAYLVDMPRPIKVGFPQYKEMEGKLWSAICSKFNLAEELPASVKKADNDMLWHECAAIMAPLPAGCNWGMGSMKPEVVKPFIIQCMPWREAKIAFLDRFRQLQSV
jgi:hypothetical protein